MGVAVLQESSHAARAAAFEAVRGALKQNFTMSRDTVGYNLFIYLFITPYLVKDKDAAELQQWSRAAPSCALLLRKRPEQAHLIHAVTTGRQRAMSNCKEFLRKDCMLCWLQQLASTGFDVVPSIRYFFEPLKNAALALKSPLLHLVDRQSVYSDDLTSPSEAVPNKKLLLLSPRSRKRTPQETQSASNAKQVGARKEAVFDNCASCARQPSAVAVATALIKHRSRLPLLQFCKACARGSDCYTSSENRHHFLLFLFLQPEQNMKERAGLCKQSTPCTNSRVAFWSEARACAL